MKRVVLVGSPNSGKSLLFNKLTGLNQKVANYPGITVRITEGPLLGERDRTLVDFPGTYSLQAISGEEHVAVENFQRLLGYPALQAVVCVVDATRPEKSLPLALQVIRACARERKAVLVAANLTDVLEQHGITFDCAGLAARLGVPVVPISARTGAGIDDLFRTLDAVVALERTGDGPATRWTDEDIHAIAREASAAHLLNGEQLVRTQGRIDAFFLHSTWGSLAFIAIMYLLFQSIFTWAAPAMDAIEAVVAWTAGQVVPVLPAGALRDFTADALFGGIGAFLVFVPQIFVLTVVVGAMEDSGYMARAALICHRPLRAFGLTGRSFVPMLSGVACAIPAIYAARSIESPWRRTLTYLAIPLMPCSARLPVYTLLIAVFVPAETALGGLVGLQGLAMFLIYFFGMTVGLLVSAAVERFSSKRGDDLPFILEMPPYRLPGWQPLLLNAWDRSRHFVTKAGVVIFWVTVVVWVLGYYPNGGTDLGSSFLGTIGHVIEPVFAPLGLDWRYAIAILSSFLAREVFVGTLGTIFGIEGADSDFVPLVEQLQASGLTTASGFALLVFFAVALQCVSTLALLGRESGSLKLPVQMFAAYSVLAYLLALLTYQVTGVLLPA